MSISLRNSPNAVWVEVDARTFPTNVIAQGLFPPSNVSVNPDTKGDVTTFTEFSVAKVIQKSTFGHTTSSTIFTSTKVVDISTTGSVTGSIFFGKSVVNTGAATLGNITTDTFLESPAGTIGISTQQDLTESISIVGPSIGGLETPLLDIKPKFTEATAFQGVGTGPSTYTHTTDFSGLQLQLTTSEIT